MSKRSAQTIYQAALLTVLLASFAFAVTHVKPSVPLWQHHSSQTLIQVQLMPAGLWGFGTVPMTMTTATGAPINGGNTTRCGFFAVYHYNLHVWNYNPKYGGLSYDTN